MSRTIGAPLLWAVLIGSLTVAVHTAGGAGLPCTAVAGNLVHNCSFELPALSAGSFSFFGPGNTDIPSWTVGSTAAAGNGVHERELAAVVGAGEEHDVWDVHETGHRRPRPRRRRGQAGEAQRDGSDHRGDHELGPQRPEPFGAPLGCEVPRSVQHGGAKREERRREHRSGF